LRHTNKLWRLNRKFVGIWILQVNQCLKHLFHVNLLLFSQVKLSSSFSVLLKVDVYEEEHFFCWVIRWFNAYIKERSLIKLANVAEAVRNSEIISAFFQVTSW
jgi:hypothetical protein